MLARSQHHSDGDNHVVLGRWNFQRKHSRQSGMVEMRTWVPWVGRGTPQTREAKHTSLKISTCGYGG